MRQTLRKLVVSVLGVVFSYLSVFAYAQNSQISQLAENKDIQVEVMMYPSPIPLKAENKYYLVYEMYLQNYNKTPLELRELSIKDAVKPDSAPFNFSAADLKQMIKIIGDTDINSLSLKPGAHALLYVWLPFDNLWEIPRTLRHALTFKTTDNTEKTTVLTPKDLLVLGIPTIVVQPPLQGKNWVAANGPSNTSIHRQTYRIGNGQLYFAQRFAIDFIKIGENGTTYQGDASKNSSYYAYNEPVFAVQDSKVIVAKTDVPENIPGDHRAVPMNAETVGGNHIVLDLGNNLYAFYAHLKPGSVKVKVGDRVKQGDLIGSVGNTGNSTEPHLHFHITDDPSFIYANGIPFGFTRYGLTPSVPEPNAAHITLRKKEDKTTWLVNQSMLENALVQFETIVNGPLTNP